MRPIQVNQKLKWTLLLLPGFILGVLIWTNSHQTDNLYKSIRKNLTRFDRLYQNVLFHYVDEVDNDTFFKAGVNGMLNTLDPYTTVIENDNRAQIDQLTQGNYGGVGLLLQFRDEIVTVGDPPFLGTPSERAGLREGDKIIEVDEKNASEMGFDKAAAAIRGPIGSKVKLTVLRAGEPKLLNFTLIREKIIIEDVRFAGMTEEGIGYVLLTRFSKDASNELEDAIRRLKAQGMKGLILDLRSNPGGVLGEAVDMADLFLPKGKKIVFTRGRTKQSIRDEYSKNDPVYGEGPLVVLTNGISASASEIVAGAIQDHDRGVVVGDTTFGKGLVQSVINLDKDAILKMTTAKYYTPSGRCIQKIDYGKRETTEEEKAKVYRTANGREVHSAGGIAPDIPVQLPYLKPVAIDLRRKSHYFKFAVDYAGKEFGDEASFRVTDKIYQDFLTYLESEKYKFEHPAEAYLDRLRKEAVENEYDVSIIADVDKLKTSLASNDTRLFQESEEDIKRFLSLELSKKVYGIAGSTRIGLKKDEAYQKALEILQDQKKYSEILK